MTPKERKAIKHKNRRNAVIMAEDDLILCNICNKKYKTISPTHLKTHGVSTAEYRLKYPNAPLVCDAGRKLLGFRKSDATALYGDELGEKLWNSYTTAQALTNEFAYKNEKFGMSESEFIEYNKSRACTLELMISRHGEELGKAKWNTYIERQRYTTSIEYFKEKHGDALGEELWNEFYTARVNASGSYNNRQSNREVEVFYELLNVGLPIDTQYKLQHNKKIYYFDYVNTDRKILIEFNGDYWHANPKKYKKDFVNPRTNKTAEETWEKDNAKKEAAIQNGFNVYYIWESDWFGRNSKKHEIINELKTLFGVQINGNE